VVIPVNTLGVMGAGLAKQCRDQYPEVAEEYVRLCRTREFVIGSLHWQWVKKTMCSVDRIIVCLPTKTDWRLPSKIEYIALGLHRFVLDYKKHGVRSVAFPRLGCGLGGLDWKTQVYPLMKKYLEPLDIEVTIYLR